MNNTLKYAALAVFVGATGVAHADPAETKGGIKIKTEDGRFEATVGGRIQFDYYLFSEDDGALVGTAPFGSALAANNDRGGANFRRARLTLTGKAYGWKYKFEEDFTGAGTAGFREMWMSTNLGPGEIIIGQHKPFRGMEELTSSNEILFMERPNTTASGLYAGRQFLTGLFYKGEFANQVGYGLQAATLQAAGSQTEGHSFGGRVFWFPMAEDGQTVHVGLAYSSDREDTGSLAASPTFTYGGRRGITATLGNAAGSAFSGTQETIHGELAGAFGSFFAQGEYAVATLSDAVGTSDADVTAYYVQAGYIVTGEKKPYKKGSGAFGSPKPNNSYGAIEVAARYEAVDYDGTTSGAANGCAVAGGAPPAASFTACEGSNITFGVNWYVNPNVRFMLNYYMGEFDVGPGQDEPEAVSLRAQFGF